LPFLLALLFGICSAKLGIQLNPDHYVTPDALTSIICFLVLFHSLSDLEARLYILSFALYHVSFISVSLYHYGSLNSTILSEILLQYYFLYSIFRQKDRMKEKMRTLIVDKLETQFTFWK